MRAIDPASVSLAVYGATQLFQLASNQRAEVYALTADKEFAEQLATLLAGTSAKVIEELQAQLKVLVEQLDYYKADLDAIRALLPDREGVATQDLVRLRLQELAQENKQLRDRLEAP